MDTDNSCDGQRAKCETKEFAHSSTQTEPEVALKLRSLSIYLKGRQSAVLHRAAVHQGADENI